MRISNIDTRRVPVKTIPNVYKYANNNKFFIMYRVNQYKYNT